MQADTIVPEPGNMMAFDRYAYVYNNPLKYVDVSGHGVKTFCIFCDKEEDISDWPEWLKKVVKGLSWISPLPFEVDLEEDVIRGPTHQEMLDSSVINIGFNPIGLAYAPITNLGKRGLQEIAEEAVEIAVRKFKLDESKFIRFGQNSISRMFRHGEFAGMTIDDVAEGLQSGRINPDQLPIKIIERDGVRYSLNNRSLMTLRLAGIEPTIVENVTGNTFFERQLTERLKEIGEKVGLYFVPIIRGARWAR